MNRTMQRGGVSQNPIMPDIVYNCPVHHDEAVECFPLLSLVVSIPGKHPASELLLIANSMSSDGRHIRYTNESSVGDIAALPVTISLWLLPLDTLVVGFSVHRDITNNEWHTIEIARGVCLSVQYNSEVGSLSTVCTLDLDIVCLPEDTDIGTHL